MNKYSKIRISVRSICILNNKMLFQKDKNDKHGFLCTIGGEVEPGDSFEERLKIEYKEEAGIEVDIIKYLFVIENFFTYNGTPVHSLEHYFLVNTASQEFSSLEPHLSFHWIPLEQIKDSKIRPECLKKIIIKGELETIKHIKEESHEK